MSRKDPFCSISSLCDGSVSAIISTQIHRSLHGSYGSNMGKAAGTGISGTQAAETPPQRGRQPECLIESDSSRNQKEKPRGHSECRGSSPEWLSHQIGFTRERDTTALPLLTLLVGSCVCVGDAGPCVAGSAGRGACGRVEDGQHRTHGTGGQGAEFLRKVRRDIAFEL